jgi:hypothetical protein
MDHWALSMKETQRAGALIATNPSAQYHSAQTPRSFSRDVHACSLLVLLLGGRLTSTGIQRSCALAAGGTFRCLEGGRGFRHPGPRRLRFRRRGCRGRHRRGRRGCGRRYGGGPLLAAALPRVVFSSAHETPRRYQGAALPSPVQALDGTYGLQPLGILREVPAEPTEQHQERRQSHQPEPYGPPSSGLAPGGSCEHRRWRAPGLPQRLGIPSGSREGQRKPLSRPPQVLDELSGVRVSILRILAQEHHHQGVHRLWDRGVTLCGAKRWLNDVLHGRRKRTLGRERHRAGEHLVKYYAQRVEVAL